jgi:hypothetical protein
MRNFRPEVASLAIVLDAVKVRPLSAVGVERAERRPTLTASARDGVGTPRSRRKNAGGAVKQKNNAGASCAVAQSGTRATAHGCDPQASSNGAGTLDGRLIAALVSAALAW